MNGGTALEAQLRALRAQIASLDAFVALLLDGLTAPTPPAISAECAHPETRDISTMGRRASFCLACHSTILGVIEGAAAGGTS